MCFRVFCSVKESLGLFSQHIDFVLEKANLVFEIALFELIDVDNVVVPMLADGASEADTAGTIFAEAFDIFTSVVQASEYVVVLLALLVLLSTSPTRRKPTITS